MRAVDTIARGGHDLHVRDVARTLIAIAIAAVGAVPVIVALGMLTSGPDRDGAGGLDWAPIAVPLLAFGGLILVFAWLVHRDRRSVAGTALSPAQHRVLAASLAVLGAIPLGLAVTIAANAGADGGDTSAGSAVALAVTLAVPGVLLVGAAWRYRRPPGR